MENAMVLQLNESEEIMVTSSNKGSVLIKNENGILKVSDINKKISSNIFIKSLNMNEINSFVLSKLLEDSEISCNRKNIDNQKLVNKILDNQFNYICGNNYNFDEIKSIKFQAITYFEK